VTMIGLRCRRSARAHMRANESRRRRRTLRYAGGAIALLFALCVPALAEEPAPSVAQLESGCLSRCASEGRDEAICQRYCSCNFEVLGRGLSEAELDRMIRLAASKERGAEQIRAWMRETAIACRGKVFGSD
jgi:hypothetical protein